MASRGKLIVFEGIDGSGKRTQVEALGQEFSRRGIAFTQIAFPCYDGFFGRLVAQFLNGEFGPLEAVDPHFAALLYAGDRLEAKPQILAELNAGKIVLADRYVGSNLAHQGSRVIDDKRGEFLQWLRELEYQVYGLPQEDLVLFLDVPVADAYRLVGEKGARGYTQSRRDLQESNVAHLRRASQVYAQLAQQAQWKRIECVDATGLLRAPAEIHGDVIAAVDTRIGAPLGSTS